MTEGIATLGVAKAKTKAPAASGRGLERALVLESELGRELNAARPAASEERIADAHVAGRGDRIVARPSLAVASGSALQLHAGLEVRCRVRNERGQERIGEVRVIEEVEEIGAKLQCQHAR